MVCSCLILLGVTNTHPKTHIYKNSNSKPQLYYHPYKHTHSNKCMRTHSQTQRGSYIQKHTHTHSNTQNTHTHTHTRTHPHTLTPLLFGERWYKEISRATKVQGPFFSLTPYFLKVSFVEISNFFDIKNCSSLAKL